MQDPNYELNKIKQMKSYTNSANKEIKAVCINLCYKCNNDCIFCVYLNAREIPSRPSKEIKQDLKKYASKGIQEVIFTGGEPTIRKDLLDIVCFAKQMNFKKIQVQTNGRSFRNIKFAKESIRAGVNEFAISLHSPNKEIHDYLTRRTGSWEDTVSGLRNLIKLNQTVLTNTVITMQNYKMLPQMAKFLLALKVKSFQFGFVNPRSVMDKFDEVVPYKREVRKYVIDALNVPGKTIIQKMVQAYPYCFMKGYEKYCSDLYSPPTDLIATEVYQNFEEFEKIHYRTKGEVCSECKYANLCGGPWKEYVEERGWAEFIPVKGHEF